MGGCKEHGRCIGAQLSHLGCHLVQFDPLIWDRHPFLISYNFSSGPPQCALLLDLHLLSLLKPVGVLNIVADERAAVRPSLNTATQSRPRVTAPQINALTHAADGLMTNPKYHWMEFIFQITLGEMCPLGLVLNYCKKSFFPEKMSHNWFLGAMIIISTKC